MKEVELGLGRAFDLADARGYEDMARDELAKLALEYGEKYYLFRVAMNELAMVLLNIAQDDIAQRRRGVKFALDMSKESGDDAYEWFIEYMAVLVSLTESEREKHAVTMMQKFGPGFLVGI